MRFIGSDVNRAFCEVAIAVDGVVGSAGRIESTPAALGPFAQSLGQTDQVGLEATSNALAIAAILRPHVGRVVLVDPKAAKGVVGGKKTDKLDARFLAQLLAGRFAPEVWAPDAATATLRRRLSRRRNLVKHGTREKNQVHATLMRNLRARPPMTDVFGVKGRAWLAQQVLPADEREMVDASCRQIDFLHAEVALLDKSIAEQVLASEDARRLLTLPGVNVISAAAPVAAAGDVARLPMPRHRVSYPGLNPKVRQSGSEPATHGRISKQGSGEARHGLVEAAWHAARSTGPLRAFWRRIAARRGANVATVAVARKLVAIAWHMLSKGEDYAFARPSLTREKIRKLELLVGAERRKGKRNPVRIFATAEQHRLEKELARQAEIACARLVEDWQPSGRRAGAGATPERASQRPSKRQAARQTSKPQRSAL